MATFKFRPRRKIPHDTFTNAQRAKHADTAVKAYAKLSFVNPRRAMRNDEREEFMQDTITDIMHLCDKYELDFSEILRRAKSNYRHER